MTATAAHTQQVRNLALLARQAIALGNQTMPVNPKMVADACVAFEAVLGASNLPADTVSTAAELNRLKLELSAAQSNIDSLTRQIEARYQEGLQKGATVAEQELREVRAQLTLLEARTGQTVALAPKG